MTFERGFESSADLAHREQYFESQEILTFELFLAREVPLLLIASLPFPTKPLRYAFECCFGQSWARFALQVDRRTGLVTLRIPQASFLRGLMDFPMVLKIEKAIVESLLRQEHQPVEITLKPK